MSITEDKRAYVEMRKPFFICCCGLLRHAENRTECQVDCGYPPRSAQAFASFRLIRTDQFDASSCAQASRFVVNTESSYVCGRQILLI
ncbi:hypothetical protein Bxe_A1249 [Paraburkholderia xenovorans LB400]|uniref:Uncharacterized protein n=1 Tax=Paraburkholderia xenovorans (strain LB400) TaxID=266265 RepID=Q13W35_PARXL|nr:hypothetical protein Bxe_A1249 [Paraburkholderia xenovorans LB400]